MEHVNKRNLQLIRYLIDSVIVLLVVATSSTIRFIYSEKATKFCEISTLDLTYVVTVKSTVEISKNCVAFSEHMNFTTLHSIGKWVTYEVSSLQIKN